MPVSPLTRAAQRLRIELPVITQADCKGCGACCLDIDHPPFIFAIEDPYLLDTLEELNRGLTHSLEELVESDKLDSALWLTLPTELQREHWEYMKASLDPGYAPFDGWLQVPWSPCHWLANDGTCRHYEYRPSVCRNYEVGGKYCRKARAEKEGAR
jgi:Fe-S-cluster containining protein